MFAFAIIPFLPALIKAAVYTAATIAAYKTGQDLANAYNKIKEKEGDWDTAQDDFVEELIEGGATDFEVNDKGVCKGTKANGDKVSAREFSSDGRPTIDIQKKGSRTKTKTRYGKKS